MRPRLLMSIVMLAVSLPAITSHAQQFAWDPITEADWRAAEDAPSSDVGATMIFERVVADDSLLVHDRTYLTVYRRILIHNADGRKWADVTMPYVHKQQTVEAVAARTVRPDGSSTNLGQSEIRDTEVVKGKGVKIKATAFAIPGVTDNCIIEYYMRYRLPDSNRRWIVRKEMPLLNGEYRWRYYRGAELEQEALDVMASWKITATYMMVNSNTIVTPFAYPDRVQQTEYRFQAHDVPAYMEEPYALPDAARLPQVRFYYLRGGAAEEFWNGTAKVVEDEIKKQMRATAEVNRTCGNFKKADSDDAIACEGYCWVQENVRNTSYARRSRSCRDSKTVDDIIKAKCGSQGDINTLYLAMMRKLGNDASIAYVVDRDEGSFVPAAKFWQFDRSLVAWRQADGAYRFMSPGDAYLEPGDVHWLNEGATAFVVRREKGNDSAYELVAVPYSPPDSNSTTRTVALALDLERSKATGVVSETRTGHAARDVRLACHELTVERKLDELEQALEEGVPAAEIDSVGVLGLASSHGPLRIDGDLEAPLAEQVLPGRVVAPPFGVIRKDPSPFANARRQSPIVFNYPYLVTERVSIAIPDGMTVEALPADMSFANDVGSVEARFTEDGGKVHADHVFRVNGARWEVADYEKVQALFDKEAGLSTMAVVLASGGPPRHGRRLGVL